ncbi:MAG: c-type cytochrome [Blastochloris sp.]|nr:c-type cytochrome [Blastochloris sp.]
MSKTRSLVAIIAAMASMAATSSMADTKPARKQAAHPVPLLAQACAGCHGQSGEGQKGTPVLAAYNKEAFVRVWDEFRNGQRPAATIMTRIARGYSDEEVATLAAYFSSIPR